MKRFVFSSESVSEGHPDKVADQISDSILDALLAKDPMSRVAAETFVATELAVVAGEITSAGFEEVDIEKIVRDTILGIGYDSEERGMDGANCQIMQRLVEQSPDIAQGTAARQDGNIGAGDQGMMFGYAQNNDVADDDYMPVPISLAHALTRRMTEVRRKGILPYIRPDTKSQVSVRFENDQPVGIDAVVLAAQHDDGIAQETIQADLKEHVAHHVLSDEWLEGTEFFINHTGKFVKGGPSADTGLTGRKIIVDTYGGWTPHGGGAFSGKDSTKVDRSAAYYSRYAAKNLVAAGVADKLQIQVAYSIGSLQPVSYNVQTFGTGAISDNAIVKLLKTEFSFAPGDIISELGLRDPIFKPTAAYGHFGRRDVDLPWERLDRVDAVAEHL
ncbi:MAG: methionine adenosyltransferase [Thermoplasmatota archaeon]